MGSERTRLTVAVPSSHQLNSIERGAMTDETPRRPQDTPGYWEALEDSAGYRERRDSIKANRARLWDDFKAANSDVELRQVTARCAHRRGHVLFGIKVRTHMLAFDIELSVPELEAVDLGTDPDLIIMESAPGGHVPGTMLNTYGEPEDDDYREWDAGPARGVLDRAHLTIRCPKCLKRRPGHKIVRTGDRLVEEYLDTLAKGAQYLTLD